MYIDLQEVNRNHCLNYKDAKNDDMDDKTVVDKHTKYHKHTHEWMKPSVLGTNAREQAIMEQGTLNLSKMDACRGLTHSVGSLLLTHSPSEQENVRLWREEAKRSEQHAYVILRQTRMK